MQTTLSATVRFAETANTWLSRDVTPADASLTRAILRVLPRVRQAQEDRIRECREALGACEFSRWDEEVRARMAQTVEIEPCLVVEAPDSLTAPEREAFIGFVIAG